VRRDEANAKEEERKKKEKAIQAEREFRLSLLRQKNSITTNSKSDKISLTDNLNDNGHINLFYEEEQQLNAGKNQEREEEEKKQKEKFESQFIYSLTGKDKEKPWYSVKKIENNIETTNNNKLKQIKKDKKRKEVEDPLELIKKNLAKNEEIELEYKKSLPYRQYNKEELNNIINHSETFTNPTELLKEFSTKSDTSSSSSESSSESDISSSSDSSKNKKHHHRKHKHKHRHKHKHKHKHKYDSKEKNHSKKRRKHHHEENKQDSKSTIEKLREERLKREQEERQRALGFNGIQKSPSINLVEEDKYFYNSQFNPDSIRQLKRQ
jgi:hypothetical protein